MSLPAHAKYHNNTHLVFPFRGKGGRKLLQTPEEYKPLTEKRTRNKQQTSVCPFSLTSSGQQYTDGAKFQQQTTVKNNHSSIHL